MGYWKAIVSRRFPHGTPVEFTAKDGKIRSGEVMQYVPFLKLRIGTAEGDFEVSHNRVKKIA